MVHHRVEVQLMSNQLLSPPLLLLLGHPAAVHISQRPLGVSLLTANWPMPLRFGVAIFETKWMSMTVISFPF
jgi:hypothetical protein